MTISKLVPAAWTGLLLSLAPGAASTAAAQGETAPVTDSAFVQQAGSGGLAEVQLGKLAQQKGASDEVKQFGQRMVTDHSKSNEELATAAQNAGLSVPSQPLPKHQKKKDKLAAKSGAEFDRAYMAAMVKDHHKQLELFRRQAESGRAESLRELASKTIPVLEQHLSLAKQVAGQVGADTTAVTTASAEQTSSR